MDGGAFVEAVRSECATELDRLGNEKALVATTAAQLEYERVLVETARAELRAAETFEAWSETEEDGPAREAFARVAARDRDHADRVLAYLDGEPEAAVDPLHEHLRRLDGTVERVAAGMVGRPLAASRSLLQVVNFFVNEGDRTEADMVREVRSETDELVADGLELLEAVCGTEAEWERAHDAACGAIDVVYREYVDTLEAMGVDPKPVC